MRVECQGLVGDDENGRVVLDALARHGISRDGMALTREAPQIYVEVMSSRETGRRTFFCFRGCADLLDDSHCDPSSSRCRIFHVGAPGLQPSPRPARRQRRERLDASARARPEARVPNQHGNGVLRARGPATHHDSVPSPSRQHRHQRPRGRSTERDRDPTGRQARLGGRRTRVPAAAGAGGPAGRRHPLPRGRPSRSTRKASFTHNPPSGGRSRAS